MHGGQFIHRIASSLMTDGSTKAATGKEMRNWQLNVPEGRKKRERERERESKGCGQRVNGVYSWRIMLAQLSRT